MEAGDSPAGADAEPVGEAYFGRNGWICRALAESTTEEEERVAWREAMPPRHNTLSPIRRPRAFARVLAGMATEQAGARGRTVLLRSTVDEQVFCTAHRSQTVYHGPVVYAEDPVRRLEGASSDLELLGLLVFLNHAAYRAQREYRFVVWADEEPEEDWVDLRISPAVVDAMEWPAQDAPASGFVSAGTEEPWTVAALADVSGPSERVEALPVLAGPSNPAVALRRYQAGRLPGDLRERTAAYAAREVRAGAPSTDSRNRAGAARRHRTPARRPRGKPVAPLRFCLVLRHRTIEAVPHAFPEPSGRSGRGGEPLPRDH